MARILEVQHAEINTAVITVKVLQIDKRQVTLAVFRQLPRRPIIMSHGELAGIPWGVVNYHYGDCSERRNHFHVVWQSGKELFHALEEVRGAPPDFFAGDLGARFMTATVRSGHKWDGVGGRTPELRIPVTDEHGNKYGVAVCEIGQKEGEVLAQRNDVRRAEMADLLPDEGDPRELWGQIVGAAIEHRRTWRKVQQCYNDLCELPQLYIAV